MEINGLVWWISRWVEIWKRTIWSSRWVASRLNLTSPSFLLANSPTMELLNTQDMEVHLDNQDSQDSLEACHTCLLLARCKCLSMDSSIRLLNTSFTTPADHPNERIEYYYIKEINSNFSQTVVLRQLLGQESTQLSNFDLICLFIRLLILPVLPIIVSYSERL